VPAIRSKEGSKASCSSAFARAFPSAIYEPEGGRIYELVYYLEEVDNMEPSHASDVSQERASPEPKARGCCGAGCCGPGACCACCGWDPPFQEAASSGPPRPLHQNRVQDTRGSSVPPHFGGQSNLSQPCRQL